MHTIEESEECVLGLNTKLPTDDPSVVAVLEFSTWSSDVDVNESRDTFVFHMGATRMWLQTFVQLLMIPGRLLAVVLPKRDADPEFEWAGPPPSAVDSPMRVAVEGPLDLHAGGDPDAELTITIPSSDCDVMRPSDETDGPCVLMGCTPVDQLGAARLVAQILKVLDIAALRLTETDAVFYPRKVHEFLDG